jgi:hypothetical protein
VDLQIALWSPLGSEQGSSGSPVTDDLSPAMPLVADPVQHVTMLWPGVQESTTIGHSRDALAIAGARFLAPMQSPSIRARSGWSMAMDAAGTAMMASLELGDGWVDRRR